MTYIKITVVVIIILFHSDTLLWSIFQSDLICHILKHGYLAYPGHWNV